MLKRNISILFIAAAYMMLMAEYSIPHHHHGGMFCMVMERCEEDGNINDEHTGHHEGHHERDNSCVAETDYIIPKSYCHAGCNSVCCNEFDGGYSFVSPYIVADDLVLYTDFFNINPDYGEHVFCTKGLCICQACGMRAPPFFN